MEKSLPVLIFFALLLSGFVLALTIIMQGTGNAPFFKGLATKHTIHLPDHTPLHVDLANSEAKRQKGLGGRRGLGPTEGMLFLFERDDLWRIWMKDMKFGIDIIWMDANWYIVDMRQYVYPDTYPNAFAPATPARYILEVSAGVSETRNLEIGDKINLNL